MAGVGNGFVEVDAEHLRQHKREKDALERAAEERRRSEEKAKRMEETVDAVAASSSLLHSQVQEQHDTTVVASLMQQQQHNMLHQVAPSAQQEQQSSLQTGYFQGQQGQAVPIVQQPQQSLTDAQTYNKFCLCNLMVELTIFIQVTTVYKTRGCCGVLSNGIWELYPLLTATTCPWFAATAATTLCWS